MPKPSKQLIIDAIINEIEQGTSRSKVVAKYCKKIQKSARTIDTYWKTANQQHTAKQDALKKGLAEVDKQAAIEARKKAIMGANERKEFLTKIITGELKIKKPFLIGGKIMEYNLEADHGERIRASAELSKMGGDYAPEKGEMKHSGQIDLKQITGIKVK